MTGNTADHLHNISSDSAPPPIDNLLVRAHGIAAFVMLALVAIFGVIAAMKLHAPDVAAGSAAITWGRIRYSHTQSVFFGWLGNAFLMFLYHAVPRLARRPITSPKLGWLLFALWNCATIGGVILMLLGYSQSLEWAEFPLIIDGLIVLCFAIMTVQFVVPLVRSRLHELFVSGWYILGGLIFTLLAYPVGNLVPELLPGAQGAAFSGLWIHDAIGLYVTPLVLAIAYFVIPAVSKRPIFSHFYSMVGFWLLFFVYPLNGTHHYVFSALPMEAQTFAIVASVILGVDVIIVVSNLLLSMRKAEVRNSLPLLFVKTGTILYLIVSLQGSMQALMPVNKLLHFSDWVIGHSHLAMLGFATFTTIGGMAYVWQVTPGVKFSTSAFKWCFWFLLVGMLWMVIDLSIAGVIQAQLWQNGLPWLESVRASRQYWVLRTWSAVPLIAGFVLLFVSFFTGKLTENADIDRASDEVFIASATPPPKAAHPWLRMAYLSTFAAGFGLFVFSFALLGIAPGLALAQQIRLTKPSDMVPLSALEEQGRNVYAREGCAYCHTQQVRFVLSDAKRFGAPTRAWETTFDYPQLWGTRRIGPDLAREGAVRSDDWQRVHLFNPRLIVAQSTMPAYPWLFDGSATLPNQDGQSLLAYLKTLGRSRVLSGNANAGPLPGCNCPDDVKDLESPDVPLNTNANMAINNVTYQPVSYVEGNGPNARHGASLFKQNCASCHGYGGDGDGAAASLLMPKPAKLAEKNLSRDRIGNAILNGVPGTAMPAWRDLPPDQIEDLIAFVQTLEPALAPAKNAEAPVSAAIAAAESEPGKKLFQQHCVSCHGVKGDGNGPAAATLPRRPSSFLVDRPDPKYAEQVIANGVPGTSMPPWSMRLSETERTELVTYVRSLYSSDKSH